MEVEMRAISAVVGLVLLLAPVTSAQEARRASPSLLKATFGKLPICFIENRCVYPDEVAYYVQGADKTLFFTKEGITFRLKGKGGGWVVKLEFVGANRDVKPRGEDQQQAVFSYFKGPEKDWKRGLKTYAKVAYEDLWPGIDLIYKGTVNELKYEFVVKPGAAPERVRLRYRGASEVETTEGGGLRVDTPVGSFEDAPPVAWQDIDGKRVPVEMRYRLDPDGSGDAAAVGFALGDYDRTCPLVLDPAVLVYCGYIGGSRDDWGLGIAVDAAGSVFITGHTESDEKTFPVNVGPDLTYNGVFDAFVAKVAPDGRSLVYCGYIGGNSHQEGLSIAVDRAGNAYVTGYTFSNEYSFPVKVGPDLTYNDSVSLGGDAFVAKVNAAGTALVYCGYIGGTGSDGGNGIAVDAAGNAYVTGGTDSDERAFPVKVGPDLTYNGGSDVFMAKVNAAGTALVYCGYIGGASVEHGFSIAVDTTGSAYVTGRTSSNQQTFPVKVGPNLTYSGGASGDAFVAKVDARGTGFDYCGYIGGIGTDAGYGIAVDAAGNACVTGATESDEKTFPVAVGPDLTYNSGLNDAFVAKVNARGTGLVYCGYIGGGGWADVGCGIAVDAAGNAYVTGGTNADERTFPVKVGPDLTYNGGTDVFMAKVNAAGTALVYCGYIGGIGEEVGCGIAVDAAGSAYVTGWTISDEKTFPVKVGPDLTYNGVSFQARGDAFVAKIALTLLEVSGTPRPAGTIILALTATGDAALPYQVGTSLGTGPIPIDTRKLDLSPDGLLMVTVGGYWPSIFSGYRGVIDSKGQAQAAIHIPNIPALIGVRLHSAFVTLDFAAPSGIKSISNTFMFSIAK